MDSFKKNIYDIEEHDNYINFKFKGTCKNAAALRQYIKDEIKSYCVDKVVFYINTSTYTNEFISNRLGLTIPNNLKCDDTTIGVLNINESKMVTCNDIQGIEFIYNMDLFYLRPNEHVVLQLLCNKGCGKMHQKWNPVSSITFSDISHNLYKFSFKLIGLLSLQNILDQLP